MLRENTNGIWPTRSIAEIECCFAKRLTKDCRPEVQLPTVCSAGEAAEHTVLEVHGERAGRVPARAVKGTSARTELPRKLCERKPTTARDELFPSLENQLARWHWFAVAFSVRDMDFYVILFHTRKRPATGRLDHRSILHYFFGLGKERDSRC